jgi:hypothetical protein
VPVKKLLAAAVVALVVVAAAGAAPPPTELVGTWTRTVSKLDVARAHSKRIKPGSTWTLVMAKGRSTLRSPGVAGYTGAVVPAAPTLVNVELVSKDTDLYGWGRTGRTLVFTKKHDQDPDRVAILAGTWKLR